MARDFVKDLNTVTQFNNELDKSRDILNELGNVGKDLSKTLSDTATQTGLSRQYSKENLNNAKAQSKAGKDILNVLNQQNKGSKLGTIAAKAKLNLNRLFAKDSSSITQDLYEQYDVQQKTVKLSEKQSELAEKLTDSLKDQLPFGSEIATIFKKKNSRIKKVVALLAIGSGILKQFAARTAVIGDEFGALGMNNETFKKDLLTASTNARRLGMDTKEVAEVVKDLTTNFGFSRDEALGLTNQILDTSRAIGVSNQEGTKLIGSLTEIGGLSFESANNFAKQTALLAQANNAAPNAVIKDIADSSETIAKFTGITPDNLAKAAIQANKLGLSLKDIGGVAESLLDFQGSLNKEIEASIILGRDINLQKARELALNNDLEGVAIEITKQVGGEAEFNKLNLIQRKALAESIGLSVEQLAKVVTNQDKVKSINDAIAGTKPFEELLGRDSLDNITKIVNDFKTIGANLVNTVGPAVSFIAGGIAKFTSFLSQSQFLIKSITATLSILAAKSIMSAIGAIFTGLGPLGLIGIPLAMGAIASMKTEVSSARTINDGHMTPDGTFISSAKGTVKLNDMDSAVFGTNLGGGTSNDEVTNVVKSLLEENKKLREESIAQTAAIRKIGAQTAAAIGDL